MRADDGISITFAATGPTATFVLVGGEYMMNGVSANWNGGNAELQYLGADGATFVKVGTDISANGVQTVDLAPGTYRFNITTTTAGSVALGRVPRD